MLQHDWIIGIYFTVKHKQIKFVLILFAMSIKGTDTDDKLLFVDLEIV